MKKITQNELDSALRIYNHAENLIGPYYGPMTSGKIEDFVSQNRWIMFPKNGVDSLRDGVFYPLPNIFIHFEDEIADQNGIPVSSDMGITYHNVDAMTYFNYLLRYRETQLLNKIKCFDDSWALDVQTKTKTDCPFSTPHYDTFRSFNPQTVTGADLRKGIKECDMNLLQKGDTYIGNGNPIHWSVTILVIWKMNTVQEFDQNFKQAFDIFLRLL